MKKRKLFPYQKQGVWKIQKFKGRALLGDEMGLGKTIQAYTWAKIYCDGDEPIVVVCPATLKDNWQNEAKDLGFRCRILSGKKPPLDFVPERNVVYIINYDILGNPFGHRTWCRLLRRMKPKLVIFDEIHYLGSMYSQRTRFSKILASKIKYRLGLSGSPITNRPWELWPVIDILKPGLFPSAKNYGARYCAPKMTPWGIQYKGATRLDELHAILKANVMIRRLKKDVAKQLPSKTRTILPVDISNRREYELAEKDFIKWLIQTHPNRAHKSRKNERLVRTGYLLRLIGRGKEQSVKKWTDDFLHESDGKLIAFGIQRALVEGMHSHYGDKSVMINGSVAPKKRQPLIDRFTKNKSCRLFFGNIRAAGTGWNGQIANHVMFFELDWTPGAHTQAEARAHRLGQTKPVNVYYLVGKNTIESMMLETIQKKQGVIDAVLDGGDSAEHLDLYDQLEKKLLRKAGKKR
jgi:SWI/SNF-related matrix-associated actin-dependent regulator 1 of chromatin subfamily A